jgi:hypothetical protein
MPIFKNLKILNKKCYIGWSAFKRRIFNPIELIFLALADPIMKAHCCQSISAGYLADH